MKSETLHISKLFLDPENPRHDVIQNQREIIKQLLETEKIENLAKDIAEQSSLSPLEAIGVLPINNEGEEYIVVEGNRRICACILLNTPNLAPTTILKKKFESLRDGRTIPSEVSCVIFQNRDEADHWIQLRHEGLQDGIGTKSWDAPQIARYAEKRGRRNANIQAIKLLDFAVSNEIITKEEARKLSITTLQRYLSNPIFRNAFGLLNNENLESKHDRNTFEKLVRKFIYDALAGIDVHSRSKSDDWRAYANKLQIEISPPPPVTNPTQDFSLPASTSQKQKPTDEKNISQDATNHEKSKPDPAKRRNLIPYDSKFSIKDKCLNRLYTEMKRLEVEGFEFSAAYLIRAFVEFSINLYMDKFFSEERADQSKLHSKILKVCDHLENNGVKKGKIQSLKIASSDQNSIMSPFILGAMVHLSTIPTKRELLSIWDRLEGPLKIIHERCS